jgi:tetratricopeptide (TPR) repeat protein
MTKKSLRISYMICILFFYAFLAYGRNIVWVDEYSLWYDTIMNAPSKSRPRLNFGNTLLKIGLPEKAIREFKIVIEKDPRHFSAYIGLGGAHLLMKNWDEAITTLTEAVSLQPDSSIAHTNLGLALMNAKLLDKAIAEFKNAIRLWPDNYAAHQSLSVAYKQSGLFKQAAEEAEIAVILKQQTNIQDVHGYGIIQK